MCYELKNYNLHLRRCCPNGRRQVLECISLSVFQTLQICDKRAPEKIFENAPKIRKWHGQVVLPDVYNAAPYIAQIIGNDRRANNISDVKPKIAQCDENNDNMYNYLNKSFISVHGVKYNGKRDIQHKEAVEKKNAPENEGR